MDLSAYRVTTGLKHGAWAVGSVLKKLAIAAALIVVSSIPVVGQVIGATVASAIFTVGVTMALATVSTAAFGPKSTKAQMSRLSPTLEPSASRKIVFGETAMNTDVRYFEPSGTDQEYIDYIVATSAHAVESIDEIWFDDRIAWSSSTGVDAFYTGYLTVATVLAGTSANYISINGGTKWGSTRRLTGCSYVHLRIKRTGNTKKAESPLVNGLPSRVTIKGKGAKIYDPRLDSTVTGGSGSQRANDQTTWGASQSGYRDNPALQLLWFLLGWKINSKLSVGCGVPPARIDLASFITAANICDEAITLAAGGTQPRYRTGGVASDSDGRMEVIQILLSAMNGTLRDSGGRLALVCMKNDLSSPVLEFTEDDILGDFTWNQTRGLDESFNAIRGKYTDPSNNALFQPVEYPIQSLTSVDGIERMQTLDLPFVQEGRRAQRIAKQALQRAQYKGVFSATFNMKALGCQVGNCVWISLEALGWSNKPFRVISQGINTNGQIPMTLIEENAAIYAWSASEAALVTPVAATVYDPLNSPFILGIADAEAIAEQAFSFIQDSPTPTATYIGQTWYKPTSKEWYYATATGTGSWQRILGDMSALSENTRVAIASGAGNFNSNNYTSGVTTIASYTFTPYSTGSKIQITVFGFITNVDSDDSTSTMYGKIYINGSAVGSEATVAYYTNAAGPNVATYSFNIPATSYSGSTLVQARFKRTGTASSEPYCQASILIEEFLK